MGPTAKLKRLVYVDVLVVAGRLAQRFARSPVFSRCLHILALHRLGDLASVDHQTNLLKIEPQNGMKTIQSTCYCALLETELVIEL